MKEYIEREAIISKLKSSGAICAFGEHLVKNHPAADVVEVVRCKDCKHCLLPSMHCIRTTSANKYPKMAPDDFCSYGERRDDNG